MSLLPPTSCHGCPAARECTQKRRCKWATPLGDLRSSTCREHCQLLHLLPATGVSHELHKLSAPECPQDSMSCKVHRKMLPCNCFSCPSETVREQLGSRGCSKRRCGPTLNGGCAFFGTGSHQVVSVQDASVIRSCRQLFMRALVSSSCSDGFNFTLSCGVWL